VDTNFWKSDVHDSFGLSVGDRGGMTLWGMNPEIHRMFTEHLNAEDVVRVKANEREVDEWTAKIGETDNHFFDTLVLCFVGASMLGVKKPHETEAVAARSSRRRRARVYH
jgi:hypothetical protein